MLPDAENSPFITRNLTWHGENIGMMDQEARIGSQGRAVPLTVYDTNGLLRNVTNINYIDSLLHVKKFPLSPGA